MVEFDAFRRDLAASLLHCAERRRQSGGGIATGEEIKAIELLERLARDVDNVDLHAFLIFELMFAEKRLARRFIRQREDLIAQVGVLYCPSNATDLVRWLAKHTVGDVRDHDPRQSQNTGRAAARRRPGKRPRPRPDPSNAQPQGFSRAWASDFSAGIGIVAPMLSLWNIGLAFEQWHERSFIAEHTAVPATVVSVDPVSGGKGAATSNSVVLEFQPSSGATCRVTWHAHGMLPASAPSPQETLPVVPRSTACEMPVIPAEIGNPMQTFTLAAALMAGGLASIKLWTQLFRHSPRSVSRPVWSPARERRHDLA